MVGLGGMNYENSSSDSNLVKRAVVVICAFGL